MPYAYQTKEWMKLFAHRLKVGTVTEKELRAVVPTLLTKLKVSTRKLEKANAFIKEITADDRLYQPAYGVWKRVNTEKGALSWLRANPPDEFIHNGSPNFAGSAGGVTPAATQVVHRLGTGK